MKIIDRRTVYKGFHDLEKVTLEHEGQQLERDFYRNQNSVAAIVYHTGSGQYLFTKQFRLAAQAPMVEIVAGLLDKPEEEPEKTMVREIEEELGYKTDKLEFIAGFYTSPGACAEKSYLYYAEVSRQISEGGGAPDEQESIKTVGFTAEKLKDQQFEDAKTLIAFLWLQNNGRI